TEPAAGSEVQVGSAVSLIVSKGPKQVTVPAIVGLAEADALAALIAAEVTPGARAEVSDPAAPFGIVISQDPPAGTIVIKDSPVAYAVSLGPPIEPRGAGGSLTNPTVIGQLDAVAAGIPTARELPLGATPYDSTSHADQQALLSTRSTFIHDPARIPDEQLALRRLGLLAESHDLATLLAQLYGQDLPVVYLEQTGHQSLLANIDSLNVAQQAMAARELGRAAVNQNLGLGLARVGDLTQGDRALAGVALEQGDGTAAMLGWAASTVGDAAPVDDAIVPGDDGLLAAMPQLLQREYSFPFLEGRLFVDRLREGGGWNAVNGAWPSPPESTEQVMHPKQYPADRPITISLDGLAGRLGGNWSEGWQQTMGELRMGVWLADGQPGTQEGPRAPIDLPRANAAAGWGGDRLVSLYGPDGTWAIVWQTTWDSPDDVSQFIEAANAAIADLPGAHAVLPADVSGGLAAPALVLITSDPGTLAGVQAALGVG
ncbi:MAG TPA: PASTA domain-containing protein, partial [Candidatus Limnocylindrales bacterium]|nr:PASTA domain-containing protein [Candidatus Limnocylindrales bacterium]